MRSETKVARLQRCHSCGELFYQKYVGSSWKDTAPCPHCGKEQWCGAFSGLTELEAERTGLPQYKEVS